MPKAQMPRSLDFSITRRIGTTGPLLLKKEQTRKPDRLQRIVELRNDSAGLPLKPRRLLVTLGIMQPRGVVALCLPVTKKP